MSPAAAKACVGIAGALAVGVACYVTGSGLPLWGLFLVVFMLEAI